MVGYKHLVTAAVVGQALAAASLNQTLLTDINVISQYWGTLSNVLNRPFAPSQILTIDLRSDFPLP